MNAEWAIAELDTFISQTVMRNASSSSDGAVFITARNNTAASDADVTKQAQVVEKIFDRVIPAWRNDIATSKNNRWTRHREAALRAREQLVREQEIKENLGENAPDPRMEPDGSKTYQSVQRGAMNLAEGIYAGIRNPLSHEADQELSEQEALEYLAAASVLARWVDGASVERMEGAS